MTAKRAQCVVPSGISVIFQLGWVPSGKSIFGSKMLLHYIIKRKIIFSAIKWEKNLFIRVSTVSNNLKPPNKVKYSVMFPFFFLISLIYLFIHLYFRLFDTWRPMIIWWVKTCFTELHSDWNQENEDPQKLSIRRSETDQFALSYCFLVNKEVKRKQNKQTKRCK